MRKRLMALGGALFSLVQVLGGFSGLRASDEDGFFLTLFYAAVWVCCLHGLFGTGSDQGAPRA